VIGRLPPRLVSPDAAAKPSSIGDSSDFL